MSLRKEDSIYGIRLLLRETREVYSAEGLPCIVP